VVVHAPRDVPGEPAGFVRRAAVHRQALRRRERALLLRGAAARPAPGPLHEPRPRRPDAREPPDLRAVCVWAEQPVPIC
jgi:hypothetical protein